MASKKKLRDPAYVLAIGTATPANVIRQARYPNDYFKLTDKKNSTDLKGKFKRICDKTMITERHTYLTEDLLKKNESMLEYGKPSLKARQDILVPLVPELGKEAALVAIKKWRQPEEKPEEKMKKITHLMFHSTSGVHMPGADCRIIKLLGLPPDVKRTMLYHQGSYISGTLLRMAKDAAENNARARILIVCSEIALGSFQVPCKDELGSLLAQAINGDGAAALIVGAEPDPLEKLLFELISASETIIPDSDGAIEGSLSEMGLSFRISKSVPKLISEGTEEFLRKLTVPFRVEGDWNTFFWAIHTGGRAILDQIEAKLRLKHRKLDATRHVLSKYGNIGSASVFFVLDEISRQGGNKMEWGILFAFGAGLTLDAVLLRRTLADSVSN